MEIMRITFYPEQDRVGVVIRDRRNQNVLTDTTIPADSRMRTVLRRILNSHARVEDTTGEWIVDVRDVLD
jgi:hypothetical protein